MIYCTEMCKNVRKNNVIYSIRGTKVVPTKQHSEKHHLIMQIWFSYITFLFDLWNDCITEYFIEISIVLETITNTRKIYDTLCLMDEINTQLSNLIK